MKKSAYVDYQQRAAEFAVGDLVYPFWSKGQNQVGRVQAVWPAIGMVDVEWAHGQERVPVEDLQIHLSEEYRPPALGHDSVPGGTGTVSVPGGPHAPEPSTSAARVAAAYLKKALYWAAADRHYRASSDELEGDSFRCPRCKEAVLRTTSYKRKGGNSERLLACPECLFLIKKCDIIGHPDYLDDSASAEADESRVRLTAGRNT